MDDELIQTGAILKQPASSAAQSSLPTVIPIVRFISQLKTTLKSRIIAPQTLRTYDEYFNAVMSTFSETFQIQSSSYLEPHNLTVAFFLQSARFHLYRHNLSSLCSPVERVDAMNRCHSVAKDTVRYITRTLQSPPSSPDANGQHGHRPFSEPDIAVSNTDRWQASVRSTALDISCAHLWRCTLILCFRGDYSSALMCVRMSAVIGDLRHVNMACGRYLTFFLDTLLERVRSGRGGPPSLERDEEMIAYLSGDLQGSTENAWVWPGSETGSKLNANAQSREPAIKIERETPNEVAGGYGGAARINGEATEPPPTPTRPANDPANSLSARRQAVDWGGWDRVERLIHELMEEQRTQQNYPQQQFPVREMSDDRDRDEREARSHPYYHQPAHNTGKRLQLAPPDAAPARTPPPPAMMQRSTPQRDPPPGPSSGASRISIANII